MKGVFPMRILLCDDDNFVIEELTNLIIQFFNKNNLKNPNIISYNTGDELLADDEEKDIVFLDIEMPGLNGIYVGAELKRQNPSVIIFIVTSYIEYLDDAMRFHVFRYLSKPLDKQRFFRNFKDAIMLYSSNTQKIVIETTDGVITLNAVDIVFIEAVGRKVLIHSIDTCYKSIHPMKYWVATVPKNSFFQTHRSFIVNMAHINAFDHQLIYLYNNQFTAYLTRRKYTQFKDSYLLYLESTR